VFRVIAANDNGGGAGPAAAAARGSARAATGEGRRREATRKQSKRRKGVDLEGVLVTGEKAGNPAPGHGEATEPQMHPKRVQLPAGPSPGE
jgi:hypothetical protein